MDLGPVTPCFLCDSREVIHGIRVIVGNSHDDVCLCDLCWTVCCARDDERAARLWHQQKEAMSNGYTDKSALHAIWSEFHTRGLELHLAPCQDVDCVRAFLAVPLYSDLFGGVEIWCRTHYPITPGLTRAAHTLPVRQFPLNCAWIREVWAIVRKNGTVPEQDYQLAEAVFKAVTGDMLQPDLFVMIANAETPAGYELIRRLLI